MSLTIREFRPADAAGAAAAYSAGRPYLVITPEVVAWQVLHTPDYGILVAEVDGEIVGTARHALVPEAATPGEAVLNVSVLPAHRRRGVGGRLVAAGEELLATAGATRISCWADDEPDALAFAAARGYTAGRQGHFSARDLTTGLPPVPALPAGTELRTAADYLDDPYPIYLVDIDGTRAEPGDLETGDQPYEEWLATIWRRPDLSHELTTVVLADGEPVAFSAAQTDGGRYWSAFTATCESHRGRGLAKIAKTDSLHRARAAGLTAAYTANDATNAPMLAINAWLGYHICAGERRHAREL
ncbi:GNAT family N-acetyltransferase [Kitasatospora terrestris]|uniref:GNAT family N-acetyltransferase n=1 Tax=Kitasatospora terrestris TaxID=258051 RepID=A0ABP9E314_9ACTN